MKFISERLKLRPVEIDDKHAIFEYRSDAETNKYQGWIPKNLDDVEQFINNLASVPDLPDSWFQLVIIEKAANNIIGDVGIHFLDGDNKQVELGCTLNKNYQGKGYALEALKTVIDYLFKSLKKHRIISSVDPANSNSIQLMQFNSMKKMVKYVQQTGVRVMTL